MSALTLLRNCGEIQKKLFFTQFFQSGKIGEITCVNGVDNEDTIMFERFENFIVCYRYGAKIRVILWANTIWNALWPTLWPKKAPNSPSSTKIS